MGEYTALVREYRTLPLPPMTRRGAVIRTLLRPQRHNMYHVVTGMRCSGKSFYLYQLMSDLIASGFDPRRILYFDFSDDGLEPLSPTCGADVIEEYFRQVLKVRTDGAYFFFDEVQELGEWQGLLRRLAQNEIVTLVITGSSSKLSSEELGTKSRGRAHNHMLSPLSFAEFCRLAGYDELAQGVMVGTRSRVPRRRCCRVSTTAISSKGFPGNLRDGAARSYRGVIGTCT